MHAREIVDQVESQGILALDGQDLPGLLAAAETIRADDTCVAGLIRVLSLAGYILVVEATPEGDLLVRRLRSREAADRLVELRLAAYQHLWGGLSCRVPPRGHA